ncbi:transposable element Tcb2 transposase [Trichonephila clavipes]|nr:transposable element Tcb2 transposase [Trichonephila clavipes]
MLSRKLSKVISGKVGTISHIRYQIQIARLKIRQRPSFRAPRLLTHKIKFSHSSDNRVRERRSHSERLNPAFALQQHTAPTAGVMIWGAIAYNTLPLLVLICGTMTVQRYIRDILQPHVLPLIQRLPGANFQQDNARPHTARVS